MTVFKLNVSLSDQTIVSEPGSLEATSQPEERCSAPAAGGAWEGRLLLGLATCSWLLLMVPLFQAGPLVLDEHGSYWILDSDLPGSMLRRSLDHAAIPPLSSWIQSGCLALLGKSEWAFRLPSALCGLAGIWICYLAGKGLGDARTGGIAALLLAWHPEAMDEVRIARCYGLVLLLGAAVFRASDRWLKKPESWICALAWSLCSAALLWTHYTSALLVMISGLAVAGSCIRNGDLNARTLTRLAMAAVFTVALCVPLFPAVQRLREWGPLLNYSGSGAGLGDMFGPWWWAALPIGTAASSLTGGIRSRREWRLGAWGLAVACGLVPLLLLAWLSSGEMSSLANPRYRVAYAPAGACLAAMLLTASRRPVGAYVGMAVLLIVPWWWSPLTPWQTGRLGAQADREWRELNQVLAEQAEPGEPIVVQSGLTEGFLVPILAEDPAFLEYVACRVSRFYVESPHPRLALPFLWDPRTGIDEFYRERLAEWRSVPGTFWVACATDTDLNRNSLNGIQDLADQAGYESIKTETWSNATLIRYQVRREVAP